mmetsp:Transcript_4655/g.8682  ORF Transcript_4655/g.8682 Transcript_4655/m.8682 type:complete len:108 (-) Transcript_4655:127-450(-)
MRSVLFPKINSAAAHLVQFHASICFNITNIRLDIRRCTLHTTYASLSAEEHQEKVRGDAKQTPHSALPFFSTLFSFELHCCNAGLLTSALYYSSCREVPQNIIIDHQ